MKDRPDQMELQVLKMIKEVRALGRTRRQDTNKKEKSTRVTRLRKVSREGERREGYQGRGSVRWDVLSVVTLTSTEECQSCTCLYHHTTPHTISLF